MIVSRQQHDALLGELREQASLAPAGLFGPSSVTWRLARESANFLGGGRAALLQAAHPFVAHAIRDHSRTKEDLAGRFQRTFLHVFSMVFGRGGEPMEAARRVRRIHERIHGLIDEQIGLYQPGHPYDANDREALLWVFTTLIHTTIQVHEAIIRPLDLATKDAFLAEGRRFAALFGIAPDDVPPDFTQFEAYFEATCQEKLAVGSAAAEICHFLLKAPRPSLRPVWSWYEIVTAGLLPENIREAFGLPWGPSRRAAYRATLKTLRFSYAKVPGRFRFLPAYTDAMRHLGGKEGDDLFGRLVKRAVLKGLAQEGPRA